MNDGKYLGIGFSGIGTVKDLIAHLDIFVGAICIIFLAAKDDTVIGIARRFCPVFHVHLNNRYGKIRPQHLFTPQWIGRDIGTRANVFSVQIQQGVRRLQNIRLDDRCPLL